MTLRLWQVVAITLTIGAAVGLMFGRYGVPVKSRTPAASQSNVALEAEVADLRKKEREFRARQDEATAEASLRAAVPAMEAYNADHGAGYTGATLTTLQQDYDSTISDVGIIWADADSYCIESSVGLTTLHKVGPGQDIEPGPCPTS